MRWPIVWHLAKKEILSTWRDRRALISNIIIPLVLMPVMMLGLPYLLGGIFEGQAESITPVAISGAEHMPPELESLLTMSLVELTEVDDAEAAVRDTDAQAGILVPEGFADQLAAGEAPRLSLYTMVGNMQSDLALSKLQMAVNMYRQQLTRESLVDAGVDPGVLDPLTFEVLDASSEQQRSSGFLGWMIPFFIAMWALMGGQMVAVDATAGEKERGTMESLLVSPISRFEVVIGKWLSTMIFGLLASIAAITGYLVGAAIMRGVSAGEDASEATAGFTEIMGGAMTLSPQVLIELFVSAILLTAFLSALLITISMFARSFKEAQSYLGPLSFLLVLPAISLQFRDFFDLGMAQYVIPVLNTLIVMFDTVRGATDITGIILTWLSMALYTVVLLFIAHRNYQREDVIFRT